MKSFDYINDLGCPKRLQVWATPEPDKFNVILWNMANGEFCGSAEMNAKEINDFLSNYGFTFKGV